MGRGFVIYLRLFTIFMDGVVKEMGLKAMVRGAASRMSRMKFLWEVNQLFFTDSKVLGVDSQETLNRLVSEFDKDSGES